MQYFGYVKERFLCNIQTFVTQNFRNYTHLEIKRGLKGVVSVYLVISRISSSINKQERTSEHTCNTHKYWKATLTFSCRTR
jgi:hypothetical protein